MRKVKLSLFIIAAFQICATSLFSQKINESPNILVKGNNLGRYGQEFRLYCLLQNKEYDNISVIVYVLDTENNLVSGLTPI